MTAPWKATNIGAALVGRMSHVGVDALAGGTGDATEVEGTIIDLEALGNPQSAKLVIAFTATLADTKSLAIACDVDHGAIANLSDAAQFKAGQASTTVATSSGGTTEVGQVELDVNLIGAKRYLRAQLTPDLDAVATDVAELAAVWIFGGFREVPATATI